MTKIFKEVKPGDLITSGLFNQITDKIEEIDEITSVMESKKNSEADTSKLGNLTIKSNLSVGTKESPSELEVNGTVKAGNNGQFLLLKGLKSSKKDEESKDSSINLDFMTSSEGRDTQFIPTASLRAIDDKDSSSHFAFFTKEPGQDQNNLTERLRITSDGNVVIGTKDSSSLKKLEVNGTVTASKFVGDGSDLKGIKAGQWTDATGGISYTAGNVGIGTADPKAKLTVFGAPATVNIEMTEIMRLGRDGVQDVKNANSASLSLGSFEAGALGRTRLDFNLSGAPSDKNNWGGSADATVMSLLANGKVGIGTTAPEDTFHVGNGPYKLVIGSAGGQPLGFGTSYLGFNAGKTKTGWKFDSDTSNNGGAVIYSTIDGSLYFSTVPTNNPEKGNQILTDTDILIHKKLVINPSGKIEYFGTSAVPRMTIDKDGNVGIGINEPSEKLEVSGVVKAGKFVGDGSGLTGITGGKAGQWTDIEGGIFYNSGNVGIGTDAPLGKLDVRGDIYAGNSSIYFTETNHNHSGIGNKGGYAAIENAKDFDALMILGRGTMNKGRYVRLWDYLQVNGNMDVTGNVGIGTTAPEAGLHIDKADTNDYALKLSSTGPGWGSGIVFKNREEYGIYTGSNGKLHFSNNKKNSDLLVIDPDGNIVYFGQLTKSSSRNLKDNIHDLSIREAFEVLESLNPVKFIMKNDNEGRLHVGFIAEEAPDLAVAADGKGIVNDNIVAILTKIIKEQQKTIKALIDDVNTLKINSGGVIS